MDTQELKNKKVVDFMTFYPEAIKGTDTISKAKELMKEGHFHHLPVVNNDLQVIGMVTQSDINLLMDWTIKNLIKNGCDELDKKSEMLLNSMLAKEYCTQSIISVKSDDNIMVVVDLFKENKFHCLPVLDDADRLIGIITTYDLIVTAFR